METLTGQMYDDCPDEYWVEELKLIWAETQAFYHQMTLHGADETRTA